MPRGAIAVCACGGRGKGVVVVVGGRINVHGDRGYDKSSAGKQLLSVRR